MKSRFTLIEPFGRLKVPLAKAFTLVELLVVVTIIAILAAILLPALGRARKMALRAPPGLGSQADYHNYTHDRQGSNAAYRDGHVAWLSMTGDHGLAYINPPSASPAVLPPYYLPLHWAFDYPWHAPSALFWSAADRL